MNREHIEASIKQAQREIRDMGEHRRCWPMVGPQTLQVLVDAAQKHLDTLPRTKTVWYITGLANGAYDCDVKHAKAPE